MLTTEKPRGAKIAVNGKEPGIHTLNRIHVNTDKLLKVHPRIYDGKGVN